MAKRKLSRQQAWRVNKVQQERIDRAGRRDADYEQRLESGELGPEQNGLVMAHYGVQVDIESEAGEVHRCHLRANVDNLVTGDRVAWRAGSPTGVVEARLDRLSVLTRPNTSGVVKPVAANIDQIVIVIAPKPEPHNQLIDRYLVAASATDIKPVLLLNKIDLLPDDGDCPLEKRLKIYSELGYQLIRASTKTSAGLIELREALTGRVSVFVGQSGVGKSSLINVLLPEVEQAVGALSAARDKGVHTTTTAKLFHFPGGGDLIDSPGIREFGLWHMDRDSVAEGFVEFLPHLGYCRFRDCRHERDPGCALLAAVESGEISTQRMDSYRHIITSLTSP
jgi:ribosome biogenesis GTPase